jgi:L-alanine-DL-glutamate epimerase-like enolase superfamily enzyme
MKIADVVVHHLAVPTKKSGPEVPFIWGRRHQVIVEVKTDEGLTGWGEAFGYGVPHAVAACIVHTLKPMLVGKDPAGITALTQRMFHDTHLFGRYGVTTFAISGVEIALWDLAAKRAGQPLYALLGGAADDHAPPHVPAYASLVRYEEEDERIAAYAKQAVKEGYTMVKVHQVTEPSVAQARRAIGDEVPLTVDINCEWSVYEASRMAMALDAHDLLWLEEPVWPPEDFEGLAEVQSSTGVPLSSGENACTVFQFKHMIAAGAATFVQPSVIKVGGVSEFLKVAALVQTANLELAPHSPYFGPGFAATLHLIAHTGQARWIEKLYFDLESPLFVKPLAFSKGSYTVPVEPGLGADLDPHALREYLLKE